MAASESLSGRDGMTGETYVAAFTRDNQTDTFENSYIEETGDRDLNT
jgi:hypothetical protein